MDKELKQEKVDIILDLANEFGVPVEIIIKRLKEENLYKKIIDL